MNLRTKLIGTLVVALSVAVPPALAAGPDDEAGARGPGAIAAQQSSTLQLPSIPFFRTAASALIGLSSAVRTVTAVRCRPRSSSRLPHMA